MADTTRHEVFGAYYGIRLIMHGKIFWPKNDFSDRQITMLFCFLLMIYLRAPRGKL